MQTRKQWKVTIRVLGAVRQTVLCKTEKAAQSIAALTRPERFESAQIDPPSTQGVSNEQHN